MITSSHIRFFSRRVNMSLLRRGVLLAFGVPSSGSLRSRCLAEDAAVGIMVAQFRGGLLTLLQKGNLIAKQLGAHRQASVSVN